MGGIAPIAVGFRIPERSLSSSTSSGTKLGSSASFEELVWTAPKRARRLRGVHRLFIYFKYTVAVCALWVWRCTAACTFGAPTPAPWANALGPVYALYCYKSISRVPPRHCGTQTAHLSAVAPPGRARARSRLSSISRELAITSSSTLSRTCRCNVQACGLMLVVLLGNSGSSSRSGLRETADSPQPREPRARAVTFFRSAPLLFAACGLQLRHPKYLKPEDNLRCLVRVTNA